MIKDICLDCGKQTELEYIKTSELISVRGEEISVPVEYYKCSECGSEYEDPKSEHDPLAMAYREYRRRHEMMQPEEIKELRQRYGLTQKDLSKLLGWGEVTLCRYEKGALQDDTHNTIIQMVKDPQNLLELVTKKGGFLTEEKREKLIQLLENEIEETQSFPSIYETYFGKYKPDILSGFRKLNINKLFQAIIFFCDGGIVKTKLNKLLFYLDFKHYKEYALSITGARYVHLTYGPVPDHYEYYYATLLNDKSIRIDEDFIVMYCNDIHVKEVYYPNRDPDLSVFTTSEIKNLINVKEYFNKYNASAIKDFSYQEKGYKETTDRQLISYVYADDLKI